MIIYGELNEISLKTIMTGDKQLKIVFYAPINEENENADLDINLLNQALKRPLKMKLEVLND